MIGSLYCVFAGVFLIGIIDKLVPDADNPHELQSMEQLDVCGLGQNSQNLLRQERWQPLPLLFIISLKGLPPCFRYE